MSGRPLSSEAGWQKYIQNKTATFTLKISSNQKKKGYQGVPLWDTSDIRKHPVKFARPGEKAITRPGFNPVNSTVYLLEINGQKYYVHWESLVKPGRENLDLMKPQTFLGNQYKFSSEVELSEVFYESLIKQQEKFGEETVEYIKCILSFYSPQIRRKIGFQNENEIKTLIQKNWSVWKNIVPIADISKDLGEIFGPLFVYDTKAKAKNVNHQLVEIEFPKQGNFPLVDFLIHWKKDGKLVTKRYSSKSATGSSSNTIKFDLVWKEIDSWPEGRKKPFLAKWKNHWIIGALDRMHENIVKKVPMREANLDVRRYVMTRSDISPLIQSFSGETSIKFWKRFSDLPKISDDLKRFFIEFSDDTIYYVLFSIDQNTGIPKFVMDLNELKKAIIRVKENENSSSSRSPEQIGFEVKF